jgi:endonuclease/exonuclease/phosphatase family metal-dependent hydrolase
MRRRRVVRAAGVLTTSVAALVAVLVAVLLAALVAVPVAALGPAAAGSAADADRHGVHLRVATYNIHAGVGVDGSLDLARTARTLRALRADVIGLQEVDRHWSARSDWRDQARALGDALGMRVFFAPIYSLDPPAAGEPRREYGLAVLSRLPILDADNHEITRLSTQDPDPVPARAPGFPEVVVRAWGVPVHVYATHLDYRADPEIRRSQVADTLRILDTDPPGARQILVGDLNAPPEAPELAPLLGELTDMWSTLGDGPGFTFPAPAPVRRIDYVCVSSAVSPERVGVPASSASDHLPVVADLVVHRDG